MLCKDSAIQ